MKQSPKKAASKGKSSPIARIKKAIKAAAKVYKAKPYELNKVQFWDHMQASQFGVTEWDVRKLGGFEALRDQLFTRPAGDTKEPGPLASAEICRLSGHQLSEYIANVLKDCSDAIGIPPHELTWSEFRKFINMKWGENDAGIAKHNITRAGGFNAIRDAYFPIFPSQNIVDRERLREHVNLNRKLGKSYAKEQFFLESVEEFSKRVFDGKIKPVKVPAGSKTIDRVVNVLLSDLHIGSDIQAAETGYQNFGTTEEARRIAALTKQICSYKHQYRASTRLVVHLIGDIIQGQLHDARDGAVKAEQFGRAVHLLSQMVAHLSASFPRVDIHCATGNHGRDTARHKERAIHQKWDSIETDIYIALHYACSALKNVQFHIPKTPFCKVDVLGHKIFTTHGDTVMKPGNPGKAIAMGSLTNQINAINATLPNAEEYSIFAVGHVHTPSMTFLDNGVVMVTNGCMVPVDQFAVSIGVLESHCGQWIWETIKGHPMGDARLIKVGKKHDEDASLDKIIRPWEGLPS
jgi:predicted phosphodiesterase